MFNKRAIKIIYENKINKGSLLTLINERVETQSKVKEFSNMFIKELYEVYKQTVLETNVYTCTLNATHVLPKFNTYINRTYRSKIDAISGENLDTNSQYYKFIKYIVMGGIILKFINKGSKDYYLGGFQKGGSNENIIIFTLTNEQKEMLKHDIKNNTPLLDSYFYKITNNILRHELQHFWDYVESNDKYSSSKASQRYLDKYGDVDPNTLEPDEKKEMYRQYYNLEHEINARMTETLSYIEDMLIKYNNMDKIDEHTFMSHFKRFFQGYDTIKDGLRKKVDKKAIKYFNHMKDEYNKQKRDS